MSAGRGDLRLAAWRYAIVAALACIAGAWGQAAAEPSVEALRQAFPQGLSAEQADAVIGVMDERAVRGALREQLTAAAPGAAATPAAPPESPLDYYGRRFDEVGAAYANLPALLSAAFERPLGTDRPIGPLRLVWSTLLLLAAGMAAKLLAGRLLARWRRALAQSRPGGRAVAAALLSLLLDLVEVAAFIAGAVLLFAVLRPPHPLAPSALFIVLRAATLVLVVEALLRFICAPRPGRPRLLPLPESAAASLYRTVLTTTILFAAVVTTAQVLVMIGTAPDAVVAVALPLSALPFAYLLVVLWSRRRAISAALSGHLQLEQAHAPMLAAWPVVATIVLVGLWLVVADGAVRLQPGTGPRAVASLLIVCALPLVAFLIHRPLGRAYAGVPVPATAPAMTDEYGDPLPAPARPVAEPANPHVNRLMRAVWLVLLVFAAVLIARLWGFDPEKHVGVGGFVVRILFDIGVILLIGYVGWALVVRMLDRMLERSRGEPGSTRAQRMATLLPLFRKVLQITLIAIMAMIVLSSLGIEIGPLLAGAGVIGIAVGLGAQSTINDILSGVFFLLEDAFHVGDYVEVGSLRGRVEGISLRSLKLRHHRGPVHTLPFGQIKSLTNYTRDWALTRLEFRMPPETDLALVKKLVKQIAQELSADPELGPAFIEPLKSQGVRRVEDNAIIVGIKYIAKPGTEQFVIRREAYHRLLAAFRKHDIELVGRGVVVKVEGPDVPQPAIGAAAVEAVPELKQAARGRSAT